MLRMQGLRKPVQAVTFAPDSRTLASAGNDAMIHLWKQSTGKELARWAAHKHAVLCLAFSPDGRLLASGGYDRRVKVWDVASRECLASLEGWRPFVSEPWRPVATAVAFAPDGTALAGAYGDRLSFVTGGVHWWQVGNGTPLDVLIGGRRGGPGGRSGAGVRTRYGGTQSLAYFADGRTIVLGTALAGVVLWDVPGRRERAAFYQKGCRAVALSPDGHTVAAAEGNAVQLWDVAEGKVRATLKGHKGAVWSVAFSPEGRLVLSGAKDGRVRLWDAATGAPRGAFDWDVGTVHHVAFAPDGMTAAVAGHSGTVVLWDVEPDEGGVAVASAAAHERAGVRPEGERRLEHGRPVKALAFSPDGQTLASLAATDCVKLWAPDTGRQRGRVPPGRSRPAGYGVAYLPDGNSLALATWYRINVSLWDTSTWVVQTTLQPQDFAGAGQPPPHGNIAALAVSPVGRHLALGSPAADHSARRVPLEDRHATVADLRATLFLGGGGVSALTFRPDGKVIAVATGHTGIVLWDVENDREMTTIPRQRPCLSLAFTPDGLGLAGAVRRDIHFWDARSGTMRGTLTGHTDEVRGLARTPDGATLLSASKDGTVRVWDIASGAERTVLDWGVGILNCIAVSPDSKTAAAGGHSGTVVVWDLGTP
jgi:WD40 repeat protein